MDFENEFQVWINICSWKDLPGKLPDKIEEDVCDEKHNFCMCKYHVEKFKDIEDERIEIAMLRDEVAALKEALWEQKDHIIRVETKLLERLNEKLGFNPKPVHQLGLCDKKHETYSQWWECEECSKRADQMYK